MKSGYKQLGQFIRQVDVRNKELKIQNLLGVSIEKRFIPSIANTVGTDFSSYKIVRKGQFAYGPVTSRNGNKISIAYLNGDDAIISSSYTVFEVVNSDELDPEYLMLWFSRPEFDRYARFKSHGSVREIFDWEEMCKVELPVPDLEEQKKIVHAYKVIEDRINLKKRINENLEAIIQSLFDKMFKDAGIVLPETIIKYSNIPDDWIDTTVGNFAKVQTGPFGTQLHNEDYVDVGTPIITVEHMKGKYIAHRNLPLVSVDDVERLKKYVLRQGDVVFSRVGAVDRAVVITKYEDSWLFSGRCLRVRPNDARIGIYLLWWFNQSVIRQLIISSAVGATMYSINTEILNNIRLIIPPSHLLDEFSEVANTILNTFIVSNLEEIRILESLQSLIQESLSH